VKSRCHEQQSPEDQLVKAFATIAEMAPQNATETLVTQMVATNDAALMFLHRATIEIAHRSCAIHQKTDSDHPNDQTHCCKRWKDLN
jgi:hypothetical protein